MAQQRRAANVQARNRKPIARVRPTAQVNSIRKMPQRLKNIVPRTKSEQPVGRFKDVFEMDSNK